MFERLLKESSELAFNAQKQERQRVMDAVKASGEPTSMFAACVRSMPTDEIQNSMTQEQEALLRDVFELSGGAVHALQGACHYQIRKQTQGLEPSNTMNTEPEAHDVGGLLAEIHALVDEEQRLVRNQCSTSSVLKNTQELGVLREKYLKVLPPSDRTLALSFGNPMVVDPHGDKEASKDSQKLMGAFPSVETIEVEMNLKDNGNVRGKGSGMKTRGNSSKRQKLVQNGASKAPSTDRVPLQRMKVIEGEDGVMATLYSPEGLKMMEAAMPMFTKLVEELDEKLVARGCESRYAQVLEQTKQQMQACKDLYNEMEALDLFWCDYLHWVIPVEWLKLDEGLFEVLKKGGAGTKNLLVKQMPGTTEAVCGAKYISCSIGTEDKRATLEIPCTDMHESQQTLPEHIDNMCLRAVIVSEGSDWLSDDIGGQFVPYNGDELAEATLAAYTADARDYKTIADPVNKKVSACVPVVLKPTMSEAVAKATVQQMFGNMHATGTEAPLWRQMYVLHQNSRDNRVITNLMTEKIANRNVHIQFSPPGVECFAPEQKTTAWCSSRGMVDVPLPNVQCITTDDNLAFCVPNISFNVSDHKTAEDGGDNFVCKVVHGNSLALVNRSETPNFVRRSNSDALERFTSDSTAFCALGQTPKRGTAGLFEALGSRLLEDVLLVGFFSLLCSAKELEVRTHDGMDDDLGDRLSAKQSTIGEYKGRPFVLYHTILNQLTKVTLKNGDMKTKIQLTYMADDGSEEPENDVIELNNHESYEFPYPLHSDNVEEVDGWRVENEHKDILFYIFFSSDDAHFKASYYGPCAP